MLKNKNAILLLVMAIVCLLSGTVFAAEVEAGKYYTADDVDPVLKEDVTHTYAAVRVEETNLTITGGNIKGLPSTEGYSMAVWARNAGASVTILDGNFTNEPDLVNDPDHVDLIYASGGANIVIEGGTFKCATPQWTLNLQDSKGSTITVKGGKFYKYDPSGSKTEPGQPVKTTNFVAEGYKVIRIDEDWYQVVPEETVEAGKYYTATDVDPVLKADVTHSYAAVRVEETNLTITGGNIKGLPSTKGYSMAVWARNAGASVTILDGNFTNEPDLVNDPDHVDLIYASGGANIVIEGGTFKCATPQWTLNLQDSKGSTITVKGGRFYKYDPSGSKTEPGQPVTTANFVAEGYKVVQDGEWYEVVCAHTETTKTDAKAAKYTTDGNIEYYTCNNCKKLFKDEACTTETNAIEVIVPMLIQVNGGNASVGDVVVDEAIKDSGNSSVVEIPAVGNATSVTVPVASVNEVVAADKGLTVETKDTTVTLDAKAVEEVAKQAGTATNITIEVTKTEEKTLNKEQKEAIKDKEVAIVLSAKILADGNEISKFNGGKVKVEIPFTPAEGTKGSDYKVYYVADDGKVEAIPTRYVKEKLVVELEHFSEYVVVKEVATAAPAPSAPAASANPNEKDNTPKTGAVSVIGLVVAMSVIGLAVLRKRD